MTVLTKMTHDLLMLSQRRSTGELVITHKEAPFPQWRLYFYFGRLVYAESDKHSVRRWMRAFQIQCPECIQSGWLSKVSTDRELWGADILEQAVQQNQITTTQAKAVIQTIVKEVVFSFIGLVRLDSEWNPNKAVPQQAAFLSISQVLHEAQLLREQWRSSGFDKLQALVPNFSPEMVPVVTDPKRLAMVVPAEAAVKLIKLMQGQRTFWDVAVRMRRPLPDVLKSILPLIHQGLITFKDLPDLNNPFIRVPPPAFKPAAKPTAPEPTTDAASDTPAQKGVIACIDDSPMIGEQIREILQPFGYEVKVITNPLQGIATLLQDKPDLIFLDLVMPNTNGYELCTFLRKTSAFQNLPIVILTGHDGVIDRMRAKMAGASDFMSKPPEGIKVLQMVEKHLGIEAGADANENPSLSIA
ncbi:response regulator [filamentous cyanobacterium LEGE 11480]|uniref:Response regulator n=1 Tax=Romeriopsis navalis LEGE 11480 TaxID=2777977 RepID=A0A928Z286_9CYAN|nr:response regulator [Romeriopsis navalis]MBE9029284.1 response regulator [Romeriopsis navalis LEGE 11480]